MSGEEARKREERKEPDLHAPVQIGAISTRTPRASTLAPIRIAAEAARAGHGAAVCADRGFASSWLRFFQGAKSARIAPAWGVWLDAEPPLGAPPGDPQGPTFDAPPGDWLVLGCDRTGFETILKLSSDAMIGIHGYQPHPTPTRALAEAKGIVWMAATARAVQAIEREEASGCCTAGLALRTAPGTVGVAETAVREWAARAGRGVAGGVIYRAPHTMSHDGFVALRAVAGRSTWEREDGRVARVECAIPAPEWTAWFEDAPELMHNAARIVRRATLTPEAPKTPETRARETHATNASQATATLAERAREGLEERIGRRPAEERTIYRTRLEEELTIIADVGYAELFCVVAELCAWVRAKDRILGPGRGSACGSVVSWAMRITEVDPIREGLWFSRFINPARISAPDFDIDVPPDMQEAAQAELRRLWGPERSGVITAWNTYQEDSGFRAAGRALGIGIKVLDEAVRTKERKEKKEKEDAKNATRARTRRETTVDRAWHIGRELCGAMSAASQHAAAVALCRETAGRVSAWWQPADAPGGPLLQIDKIEAEELDIVKVDVLALQTLRLIEDASAGEPVDWERPADDPATYRTIARGLTDGVFQLEGHEMRAWAQRLKVPSFDALRTLIAMFRRATMKQLPTYAARIEGREPVDVRHPAMEPVLRDTHGIMLFQEQVTACVKAVSGLSESEADEIRYAIGKKKPEVMERVRPRFIEGAMRHGGMSRSGAQAMWDELEDHAGYSFNRAHATGYSRIAYETAWSRTHRPGRFFASLADRALARAKPDQALHRVVIAAARAGVRFHPPDPAHPVRRHDPRRNGTAIEIRSPLHAVHGVGRAISDRLGAAPRTLVDREIRKIPAATAALIEKAARDGTGWPGRGIEPLPSEAAARDDRIRGELSTIESIHAGDDARKARVLALVLARRGPMIRIGDETGEIRLWLSREHREERPDQGDSWIARKEAREEHEARERLLDVGATVVATLDIRAREETRTKSPEEDGRAEEPIRGELMHVETIEAARREWPTVLIIHLESAAMADPKAAQTLKAITDGYRPGTGRIRIALTTKTGKVQIPLKGGYQIRAELLLALSAALGGIETETLGPLA